MITRLRYPKGYQFFDGNGAPLALGNLSYFAAGTTTPQDTYSDSAGTVPNSNPIVLDGSGRLGVDVYLGPAADYKEVLTCASAAVSPWPDDNIPRAAQPDWNATSGPNQILNRPVLAAVAKSGSYTDLLNTPPANAPFTGDSGSGGISGLVPAPAAGDAAANKFLSASGGWAVPSAGSGGFALSPATATALGGVKIGANVTVGVDGTISVAAPLNLPIAASNVSGIPTSLSGQNLDNIARLGIGTTDTGNKLSVSGATSLFSNSGDVRITMSKGAAANTAAFNFQDNFSTRVQFGLLGNDSFTISCSPDGSTFNNGLVISSSGQVSTGLLTLPSLTVAGLPAASTAGAGTMAWVTDSTLAFTSANFGATAGGGGTNKARVISNGANWIIA